MKQTLTHFFSDQKLILMIGSLSLFLLIFVGCADHNTPTKSSGTVPTKFGYGGTNADTSFVTTGGTASNGIAGTTSPDTATNNTPANPFLSQPSQPTVVAHDLPYGTPVPGKPGFVTSPHSPGAGYVDVRGFPPGTEVKDPYSGKVFLVP